MKGNIYSFIMAMLISTLASAQTKIKDGSQTGSSSLPAANAVLELESINRGLLLPRVTTVQMQTITPSEGLVLFNITESCIYQYNGGQWNSLCSTADFCEVVTVSDADDETDNYTNPNTSGGIFEPATPQSTCAIYVSEDGGTWTWNGSSYVTKPVKVEPWFDKATQKEAQSVTGQIYHLGSINVGNGTANGKYSVTFGQGAQASGFGSLAGGYKNVVAGTRSAAWGYTNTVTGPSATAWGKDNMIYANAFRSGAWGDGNKIWAANASASGSTNQIYEDASSSSVWGVSNIVAGSSAGAWGSTNTVTVDGARSAAWGNSNSVSGANSLAFGLNNIAAGTNSMAAGNDNQARAYSSATIGANNSVSAAHNNSIAMGNGASSSASNQFSGRFSGGVRFFTVATTNATPATGVKLDNGDAAWSSLSDRRSKNSIKVIPYGLDAVMALRPSAYKYNGNKNISLGFIAQEVQKVVPEVISTSGFGENSDYLGIRYSELIPVLTRAIQEQQAQIDALKAENTQLKRAADDVVMLKSQFLDVLEMLGKKADAKVDKVATK